MTDEHTATKSIASEFLGLLEEEMARVRELVANDEVGIGLICAVRELDLCYLSVREGRPSLRELDAFWLLRAGLPHYVRATFEQVPSFRVPTLTIAHERATSALAKGVVRRVGQVHQGRRLAFAAMDGAISVEKIGPKLFRFKMPSAFEGIEAYERAIEADYFQTYQTLLRSGAKKQFGSETEAYIEKLLAEHVYVWRGRYIGYNAHPSLDDYFFGMAYGELFADRGFDSFHFSLQFGGVCFREYRLALAYLLSVARKHERFCRALIRKHPDIKLEDIITVTGERQDMIDGIYTVVNRYGPSFEGFRPITMAQAETIYRVLSVRRDNAAVLGSGHATVPLLIEISPTHVVKSVAGAQISASHFLLDALRHNFKSEYDRHQRTREKSMQKALRRILSQTVPGLEYRENIDIKRNGKRRTDIDFVAIDPRSRTALLFQLKHQDAYGADMQKRLSRSNHLIEDTLKWSARIDEWLAETPRGLVASTLRLRKGIKVEHYKKVVIGRHFAHILHAFASKERFAVATFMQFGAAVDALETQGDFKTLEGLFNLLLASMAKAASYPAPLPGAHFDLGETKFEIEVVA